MAALPQVVPIPAVTPPPKRQPFGIKVPRSPQWPPYRWERLPGGQVVRSPGESIVQRLFNWLKSNLPFGNDDVATLADSVAERFRHLAIASNEDIFAAYNSNLNYSHAILQYVEAIGRAAEHDLRGIYRDINQIRRTERSDIKALQHVIHRDRLTAQREANKARAYAIKKSMANTEAYIHKHWEPKIRANYDWLLHRDLWFKHSIDRWWTRVWKHQISPIRQAANGWRIPFGGLWGHINAKINPTVKLVGSVHDWLKFLKHWEKRALEAFGVLKAGEVLSWLVREKTATPPQ